jgi:hypothetical protein
LLLIRFSRREEVVAGVRILFSCCFLLLPQSSLADTVWLHNGDKLTGDIISLEKGKLTIKTELIGQVFVQWRDVKTLSSGKPLLLQRNGSEHKSSQPLKAAEKGFVTIGSATDPVLLASIQRISPLQSATPLRRWEGNLDVKIDLDEEQENSKEWNVQGETRLEQGRWRHIAKGKLESKKEGGAYTRHKKEFEYSIDRYLAARWFFRGDIQTNINAQPQHARQILYGAGPGYRIWSSDTGRFELIAQLNRIEIENEQEGLRFNTTSLGADYKQLFFDQYLELFATTELHIPQIEAIEYVFGSEFGLRYRLTEQMRLSLLYELNRAKNFGVTTEQRSSTVGIGVSW